MCVEILIFNVDSYLQIEFFNNEAAYQPMTTAKSTHALRYFNPWPKLCLLSTYNLSYITLLFQ